MWIFPLFGLLAGALIGTVVAIQIPIVFAKYLSVAVLAALDSVLGGVRCVFEDTFNGLILITGFISNALLAALLAYLGDRLGVDLYMAAIFVFGVRIFQNLATIRHYLLAKLMRNSHSPNRKSSAAPFSPKDEE